MERTGTHLFPSIGCRVQLCEGDSFQHPHLIIKDIDSFVIKVLDDEPQPFDHRLFDLKAAQSDSPESFIYVVSSGSGYSYFVRDLEDMPVFRSKMGIGLSLSNRAKRNY